MADKVLADPSRKRLFEKDDIYSLLALPAAQYGKLSPETADSQSEDEEEGQLNEATAKIKCVKLTKKTIKKDKKFQTFADQESKRLMEADQSDLKT